MSYSKEFLIVIPARKGSERVPNKNIIEINGKPMISWTLEAAIQCQNSEILVSTDDTRVVEICEQMGVSVPFLRPKDLSQSSSTSIEVIKHAISYAQNQLNLRPKYVMLLQPTSPLRTINHINSAIEIMRVNKASSIVSIVRVDNSNHFFMKESAIHKEERSFLMEKNLIDSNTGLYKLNGAIYICEIERLLEENSLILKSQSYTYVMNQIESIDIDTQLDLEIAKLYFKLSSII